MALELPNAAEIILTQAKKRNLCKKAQLKAFELPNTSEIILAQAKNGFLCKEAKEKARSLGWL